MEKEECTCSFCQLRKQNSDNFLEQLIYLRKQKDELMKQYRAKNEELIDMCIKYNKITKLSEPEV